MFNLEIEAALTEKGGEISLHLVQISFSPQPSAAIKIKDGGHNFRYGNIEHSLTNLHLLCRLRVNVNKNQRLSKKSRTRSKIDLVHF